MKNFFAFCAAVAAITGITGTLSACDPEPKDITTIQFHNAMMYYIFPQELDIEPEVGLYDVYMSVGNTYDDYPQLNLRVRSDYYEDAVKAIPAEGVYVVRHGYNEYTFDGKVLLSPSSYEPWRPGPGGGEPAFIPAKSVPIVGGSFTVSHRDGGFVVDFDFVLETGQILRGSHDHIIYSVSCEPDDMRIDSEDDVDGSAKAQKIGEMVCGGWFFLRHLKGLT